ncbi:MAG: winged helix-turn-helix domain-containing protein [Candidatus Methylomirabilales bacterium]
MIDEELLSLFSQGLTQRAIAERTGLTASAIYRRVGRLRVKGLLGPAQSSRLERVVR